MTLNDIRELLTEAEKCLSEQELMKLFDDAGEDIDARSNERIFKMLSEKKKPSLLIGEEEAVLDGKPVSCPKCKNRSVHTLLGSAAEVLSDEDTLHFGCCECGTQFTD